MFYAVTKDGGGFWLYGQVSFSGTWAPATALTGGQVFRDPSSPYTRVIIGSINTDGTYPVGTKIITVPSGTTDFTAAQLSSQGLNTIGDISNAPQITAAP